MGKITLSRRSLMGGSGAAMLAPLTSAMASSSNWRQLAEDVRAEMLWAWANYREHAWGKDQIKPMSGG